MEQEKTLQGLLASLRELPRLNVEACDCALGPHLEVEAAADGDYVRWEDVFATMQHFLPGPVQAQPGDAAEAHQDLRETLKKVCDTYGRLAFMAGSGRSIGQSEWLKADDVLREARELLQGMAQLTCGDIIDDLEGKKGHADSQSAQG